MWQRQILNKIRK
ncbi:unnamed protein product [Tuber melanosporum]|uniref:(Perigord truffle) hypothetical protein n=1 Tax=Tuber melanosporum (strain Mel28) TaxID=656061 RepID=D5GGW2_TUBMM|nr:unnamed protein product [Tuber melanosporum]